MKTRPSSVSASQFGATPFFFLSLPYIGLAEATAAKLVKIGVKVVKTVDKSGFAQISKPIQDKLASDLGPNAVKVLGLVRNVK